MTIDQVVDKLKLERDSHLPHRFPCRIVMVRNIANYCTLLARIHEIDGAEMLPSSALFGGPDIMPRYENLLQPEYSSKWVVLTGVSEYLRLFGKSEMQSRRFAKIWGHPFPTSYLGRIIIPLWGCETVLYDQSLHLMEDLRRVEDCYFSCLDEDDEEEQSFTLDVYSDSFRDYKDRLTDDHAVVLDGLKEWYDYWAKPSANIKKMVLITARFESVQQTNGDITVHVMSDKLSLIKGRMKGGDLLTSENCPVESQDILLDAALEGHSLDNAILSAFNQVKFSGMDVMGKWKELNNGERQLACLWYQIHQDGSYLCHCLSNAKDMRDVEFRVLHEIFSHYSSRPEWIKESQDAIDKLGVTRDGRYLEEVAKIPDASCQLKFLSCKTSQERSYLLQLIGKALRTDGDEILDNQDLHKIYPKLSAYLDGEPYDDEDLRGYMKRYKSHKLANTLPEDETLFFGGITIDDYKFRYPVLLEYLDDDCYVLWIDALGVEWMPLLLRSLQEKCDGKIVGYGFGQANLPTETEFNMQWKDMKNVKYGKLDKLDKLAHKGVVDDSNYYSCVDEQIRFVSDEIPAKVASLMRDHHRVIVTSDHGTSRLAARFFHQRDGMDAPKGGMPRSHGRYALLASDITPYETQKVVTASDGNNYLVFRNYDHFKLSGNAAGADDEIPIYGEVHGGATPEEALVPIIAMEGKTKPKLKGEWENETVKISMRKAKATITFNQPVHKLEAKIGSCIAQAIQCGDNRKWELEFPGIHEGANCDVTVIADGKLVPVKPLSIVNPLKNAGGDFD